MNRNHFLKLLVGLPFGPFLAKKIQAREEKKCYLLNKFYIAGFQYYGGPSIIQDVHAGESLKLAADPENDYDKFAVAIYRKDVMVGHVPRTDNKHISRLLQQEVSLQCKVIEVNPEQETWKMLKVEIRL